MMPNKFWWTTHKAIRHWIKTGSNEKFTPYLIRRIEREWKRCAKQENDYRELSELNGYGFDDSESIRWTMIYISDRFVCSFRLKWLLEGLRNGSI